MQREIREVDLTDLSRPDVGSVAPWVRAMICGAALAIIGVAAASARALWKSGWHVLPVSDFWFRNGLAIALGAAVAVAFLPGARVSRFVRLAVLLPIILVAGMIAAWVLWALTDLGDLFLRHTAPLLLRVPIGAALAVMLAATCTAALAARRRRAVGWARAMVATALVELLLLGLWLPILSWWWARRADIGWDWDDGLLLSLGSPALLVALALGPPLVLAAAFAALGSHRPALVRRTRPVWATALGLLFAVAVTARLAVSAKSSLIYINLVHFLAASALVAAVALMVFVGSLWWRGRRAQARLARDGALVTGVVAADPDAEDAGYGPRPVVACLELEGWLRGLRPLIASFEVVTPAGRIPIPMGAELAASLSATSTVLHVGESIAVIRRGDRVAVGGLVAPPSDHPFRGSSTLIPGPDGLVVRRHDDDRDDFTSAALVAWRPCVALLVILIAVAIPGLAAVLVLP